MPKFFVKRNQIKDNIVTITGKDVNHIKNVLRLNINDNIQICNIDTLENYTCEITKLDYSNIECNIINKINSETEPNTHVTVFQGLPKADKMELIIQKSVELGVYEITPVKMERCVVKLDEKTKLKKVERWQKISETAAKQAGRDIIPKINLPINIKNICKLIGEYDIVLLAYEKEEKNTLKEELQKYKINQNKNLNIGIIIGPEGGLEENEVEELVKYGAIPITLGKRILRTETVAFTLISIIMYELDDLGGVLNEEKCN